ncbi:tRNA-specific adenosine deaminase [Syntrophotalea acetylenivorans]|uniref:tRNA-specific adenosine deaminase n=1 Tax=Syntrophotalea acetylenivorans TaxID=1842532 RepID=A0A1L3GP61_9BACT|nr:nucleoside deaminase [Syntrophotalea acetylenivorans]APG27736.1 tRNA-specific adenosine deaminase [Syntrophotalea acetylenivorans]
MPHSYPDITLSLPDWLDAVLPPAERIYATREERMELVIHLARQNIQRGTGGPFAAAVFNLDSGKLLAPGVNLVLAGHCSVAHAELVALMLAQQLAGSHDLGGPSLPPCELVTSTEPCAMCLGALPWSGIASLVCGAREGDAREIGFDEGDKPADWPASLQRRGIAVYRDVRRLQALAILEEYRNKGGPIYNGRSGR